jgi:hypothetical protein
MSTMMDQSTVWNGQDPTLSVPSQDDFQQFLDMNLGESLNFDFQDFDQQQAQTTQMMEGADGMDTRMDNGRMQDPAMTMQEHIPAVTTATTHPTMHASALAHGHPSNENLADLDAQIQYLQHQRHQQQQRQIQEQQRNFYANNRIIPPTPNSTEMVGNNGQFFSPSDPQQQAIYERYRMQVKDQEVGFQPEYLSAHN